MRIIGRTTVEDYFHREFHSLIARHLSTQEQYNNGITRVNEFLRQHDGDIHEYAEVGQFKSESGLCVIDSGGNMLAKIALK